MEFVVAFVFLSANCSAVRIPNPDGRLQVMALEPAKVEIKYLADKDGGVYILSEVKGDSRFLLVTTLQGEQLYRATSPNNKDIIVSLMEKHFLITSHDKGGKITSQGFLVPEVIATAAFAEPEEAYKYSFSAELEGSGDDDYSLSVMRSSYERLLNRDESVFFIDASKILGREMEVSGRDYPAAMSVYVVAMRLAEGRNEYDASDARESHLLNTQESCTVPGKKHCSSSNSCCYKCALGKSCLGMCGPGCTCWSWVCGDCCYHKGCYDHDRCCAAYLSWSCLSLWKFTCRSYSCR